MSILDTIRKALGRRDDAQRAEPPVGSMTPEKNGPPASADRGAARDAAAHSGDDVADAASSPRDER